MPISRADFHGGDGRCFGSVRRIFSPLQFPITSGPNRCKVVTWRMNRHEHFHFSVTIQSKELFMVSAMRKLAWECQPQINRQIAAAGTNNDQWARNQGRATFYFTSTANRTEFLRELSLILPTGWEKSATTIREQRRAKVETLPLPIFKGTRTILLFLVLFVKMARRGRF